MENDEIKKILGTSNYLLYKFKEGSLNKMLINNKPTLIPYFFILDILRNIVVHGDSFNFETTSNKIENFQIKNYNTEETLNKCEIFYKKITNNKEICNTEYLLNMMQYVNDKLIFELELTPQEEISEEEAVEEKTVEEDEIIDLFKKREEIRNNFGNKRDILKRIEELSDKKNKEELDKLNEALNTLKKINVIAHHKTYNFEKPKSAPSLDNLAIPPQLMDAIQEFDVRAQKKLPPRQQMRK